METSLDFPHIKGLSTVDAAWRSAGVRVMPIFANHSWVSLSSKPKGRFICNAGARADAALGLADGDNWSFETARPWAPAFLPGELGANKSFLGEGTRDSSSFFLRMTERANRHSCSKQTKRSVIKSERVSLNSYLRFVSP